MLQIFGMQNKEEIIGKTDYELPWAQDADGLVQNDKIVLETGVIQIGKEELVTDKYGNVRTFMVAKAPMFNAEGQIIGTVGNSIDITTQKHLEKELVRAKNVAEAAKQNEEELRKAATIFAGSMAHDLTNPLVIIRLMAGNMASLLPTLLNNQADTLNEMQLNHLQTFSEKLEKELDNLNEYIRDSLKALHRTVAGIKTHDDLVKCELWRCMQKVVDTYPYVDDEKKLIEWDGRYTFSFMGNPLLFYRILFNLMKNSLYQMNKHGRGKIYIHAEKVDGYNILYFKDTAGHVTQEVVDNIFNSYQSTKQDGTGVGLAFCKLTMQSFGGDMTCHLVDKDCIEFRLQFPIM